MAILKRDDNGIPIEVYGQYGPITTIEPTAVPGSVTRVTLAANELYEFTADGGYIFALGSTTVSVSATEGRFNSGFVPIYERIKSGNETLGLFSSGAAYFTYVKVG